MAEQKPRPKGLESPATRRIMKYAGRAHVAVYRATKGRVGSTFRVEVPLPTPEELRKSIADGLPFWAKIIRDNNIKAGS